MIESLDPKMECNFLEARLQSEEPYDEMFINGDSARSGFRSLDGVMKRMGRSPDEEKTVACVLLKFSGLKERS